MFRNTLTANDKDPVWDCVNLPSPIQMQLSLKPTIFLIFLFNFWNLHQILNILKNKMTLIAPLFGKSDTVKELVRPLFKKQRLRDPFKSQHIKGSQTLVKYPLEHFYQIFSIFSEKLIWKISPLVIY